jgi:hypothetical protein
LAFYFHILAVHVSFNIICNLAAFLKKMCGGLDPGETPAEEQQQQQ